ncbi:MAG TPA: hypothetical protein VMU32_05745 [Solirubrobacteraceae bacterium]|nr:hypothetical protein [Solirubrobacteraceae bacterium]
MFGLGILILCPSAAASAVLSEAQIDSEIIYQLACPAATQCTVTAGTFGEPKPGQEVTFNPTLPGTPSPVTIDGSQDLFSIACPTLSQCTVGDVSGQELTFDPTSPGESAPVNVETGLTYSVACPSESQCTATGNPSGAASTFDPREPQDATHFTLDGGLASEYQAVFKLACPSAIECVAVSTNGTEVRFNPQEPGTPIPVSIDPGVALGSLACPSTGQCTALAEGAEITFNPASPGIPSPVKVGGPYALHSLACPSTEQCTAGASEGMEVTFDPLAPGSPAPIHIDAEAVPGVSGVFFQPGDLIGLIACPSVSQCTAVDNADRELTFDPDTQTPETKFATADDAPQTGSQVGNVADGAAKGQHVPAAKSAQEAALEAAELLAHEMIPDGKAPVIDDVLGARGFTITFKAPSAGTALIDWYSRGRGTSAARRTSDAPPILVATGRARFAKTSTGRIRIELTRAGIRLLKHAKKVKLIARGIFTPTGGAPAVVSRAFTLAR